LELQKTAFASGFENSHSMEAKMEESFHYLLMANQSLLQKKLLAGLKKSDLTLGQPKILDYLKEHNGSSQKEIAAGCHIEAGSLTSVLSRMEEKGMIERKMLNGNRRSLYVFLTAEGKRLQKMVDKEFRTLEEKVFEGVSNEERKEFMRVFAQIYKNLN
jgi:DNA-binding MarR family transcriptional regulator